MNIMQKAFAVLGIHGARPDRRDLSSACRRLPLAVLMLSLLVGVISAQDGRLPGGIRVRKSVIALTAQERTDFVEAVLALKRARSPFDPSLTYYDQFVRWHKDRYICHPTDHASGGPMQMVHAGPMFLPWHRELLRRFEDALRDVSEKDVTLPYWDWTDRESINPDNPKAVFRDDFMGGSGDPADQYAVNTGPFRKGVWALNVHPEGAFWARSRSLYITRNLGNPYKALPTRADVDAAFAADEYDVPPYDLTSDRARSFRNALEGEFTSNTMGCGQDGWMAPRPAPAGTPGISARVTLHNLVHPWVGGVVAAGDSPARLGTMILSTSPNDPVFFLHHANVDRLWEIWQTRRPDKTYQPRSGEPGNNADSPMVPFGDVTPNAVERITPLGYRYQ